MSSRSRIRQSKPGFENLEKRELLTSNVDPPLFESFSESSIEETSTVEYRSTDGSGNNLLHPEYGSVGQQLLRVADSAYSDGISTLAGSSRPSAREVSNAIAAQNPESEGNARELSAFAYVWGQFLDHDIDFTEPVGNELANIEVPLGDPFFDPAQAGNVTIPFTRSRFDATTGDSVLNPRQQVNGITAWVDGSMIYGSDQATADSLRTFEGGRLLTSDEGLPPVDEEGYFYAGDIRANENIELTAMHALFIREHNWWADRIAEQNDSLTDEQIYQQARAIVIAEIQVITYEEFLPALVGRGAIDAYQGYDPSVNPSIANEFSTAAFRLGHSLLNDDVEFFDNDGRVAQEEVALSEAFNNPDLLRETGIDSILKYVASSRSQEVDSQIVDSVRNFLFGQPGTGGLDLASLNIQRGRDHGLADYNSVRDAYGLSRVTSVAEISSDPAVQETLLELYGSVDDIDLWVGALAEHHVEDASAGELVHTIVVDQFTRLRDGDRFWYENVFSEREVSRLRRTTLADVIERNTAVDNLQENVFFMSARVSGRVTVDNEQRRPNGVEAVVVQLLDDEGAVVDVTETDAEGRYEFTTFRETGDYQIVVFSPVGQPVEPANVLISRGEVDLRNIDFRLNVEDSTEGDRDRDDADDRDRDRSSDRSRRGRGRRR